jgi:hypothetical protein
MAVEEVKGGETGGRSVGQRGGGGATSAMGRAGGVESTEVRWSWRRGRRGQRHGEIGERAVTGEPEVEEDEARWAVMRSPYCATGHVIWGH